MKPNFNDTEAVNSLVQVNRAFAELTEQTSNFPACPACQQDQERRRSWQSIPSLTQSWAFKSPASGDIESVLGMALCPLSSDGRIAGWPPKLEEVEQVYRYVIQLMRCWASQGGSPKEIQDVLTAADKVLKLNNPRRWI